MLKLRSTTVFQLLCGAIGLEALGLLGMVAAMLYPLLVSGQEEQIAGPEPPPTVKKAASLSPSQAARRWMDVAWPPPAPDEAKQEETAAGPPVDAHDRITFVGSVLGASPEDQCAFFQRQTDRKQWSVWVGGERENVKLIKVTKDLAVVEISGAKVALNKVAAMAPGAAPAGRGPARGGTRPTPGRPTPASGGSAPAAATVTTSGSYRLASGGDTPSVSSATAATSASSTARTTPTIQPARRTGGGAMTTSQSATTALSQNSTPSGQNSENAESPAGRTQASSTPGTPTSRSSTNWRQYWAERLKKRRDAEQAGQPEPNQ